MLTAGLSLSYLYHHSECNKPIGIYSVKQDHTEPHRTNSCLPLAVQVRTINHCDTAISNSGNTWNYIHIVLYWSRLELRRNVFTIPLLLRLLCDLPLYYCYYKIQLLLLLFSSIRGVQYDDIKLWTVMSRRRLWTICGEII